ncbi:hypothetical protein [uncultured Meiothermus sp.]|jgi:hypothetical protein|uniref:hypothetical protein n=1 Tax=uncultured Meiothermus sp. TaxID=157471 RepID=UPI00260DF518|nr:hypothetical protein [uncultured Meiothermus sp.]
MLEAFFSQNHRISAPRLGKEWSLEEQSTRRTTRVMARLTVPGQFAFFVAEDSQVEVPQQPEAWARMRQAEYAQNYQAVNCNYRESVSRDGVRWLEVSLEITLHARLAPLNKLERIAVVGSHRLILSVEASAKDLRKFWLEAQQWFDEVQFAVLKGIES